MSKVHKIIFYPVGNGDTSQIILKNGKRILIDFYHRDKSEDSESRYIDLISELTTELKKADVTEFDVVAFTHSDKDHINNFSKFFKLEKNKTTHTDERIGIRELWVPAAILLESATNDKQSDEFIILRDEARYRLKNSYGIKVFSKHPEVIKWLEAQGIPYEDRKHLFVSAGKCVPTFTSNNDSVEFFCHSPYVKHVENSDDIQRNESALIFNICFHIDNNHKYNLLHVGDSTSEIIEDIVDITKKKNNTDWLKWDIFNIPHHCSYKALSKEKGDEITIPVESVDELLHYGNKNAYIINSSKAFSSDKKEAYESDQPPHLQAKNAYLKVLEEISGREFITTMEYPNKYHPQPLEFEIGDFGIRKLTKNNSLTSIITSPIPRAG
ncbi:MAG: hypothetical protein K2Q03_10700 [Sphingobacteriaceae bacterium]|nr:hypothetical protein [Sphingobacteriaceae bacterium]